MHIPAWVAITKEQIAGGRRGAGREGLNNRFISRSPEPEAPGHGVGRVGPLRPRSLAHRWRVLLVSSHGCPLVYVVCVLSSLS